LKLRRKSNLYEIKDCYFIDLPKNQDIAGNLTAINENVEIPFPIARVYYTYDIPGGAFRGGHAHKELQEFIVAVSGSFDLVLDDGLNKKIYNLKIPHEGVFVAPGIWRELTNFSSGAVCLVLASRKFEENDYIRNYSDFLEFKRND
jgi:dTDP-4-dehydrorhamnose 3,5-epimerase-like enzyme